jgi:hypothetical protein
MAVNAQTGPSPAIFGHLAGGQNHPLWAVFHEDFHCGTLAASGVIPGTQVYGFLDGGNTCALQADQTGGVMRLAADNTQDDSPTITTGDNVAGFGKFDTGKAFAAECRISVSSIAAVSYFFGLMEEGLAVNDGIFSDAAAIADVDYVGFRSLAAAPTELDAVYRTGAGGGEAEALDTAQTLVASTWYKLGVRGNPTTERVYWYVDGAEVSGQSTVTYTTAEFPNGEELAFYICLKNDDGVARSIDIDWIHMEYER